MLELFVTVILKVVFVLLRNTQNAPTGVVGDGVGNVTPENPLFVIL